MTARHSIEYSPDADFMRAADAAYILARAMFPDHELISEPRGNETAHGIIVGKSYCCAKCGVWWVN